MGLLVLKRAIKHRLSMWETGEISSEKEKLT